MFEYCYCLVVDGGALNQGSADSAGYGSFRFEARTGQKQTIRLDFGCGVTNNEAEYQALIAALKDLVTRIKQAGRSPSGYSLLVHTDSQLMVGQLTQGWKIKAANLRPLVDEAAALIHAFGRCDPSPALGTGLVKVPRAETCPEQRRRVMRVLGH